jgi:Amt family ammonium transporter
LVGLLAVGIFADGTVGQGWHMTGLENYLGVTGQGVSGLFTERGFQPDFPAQLQAQVIGILSLILWGFSSGMLICAPLGLLLHSLLRSTVTAAPPVAGAPVSVAVEAEADAFATESTPAASPPPRRPFAPKRSPFS